MKIETGTLHQIRANNLSQTTGNVTPVQTATAGGEDAVSVNLSAEAHSLGDDVMRMDRLASIREQLASGTYNISGKDVANKILKALKG